MEIYLLEICVEVEGIFFIINWELELEIFVFIIGEYNVFNIMVVMFVVREIGIEGEKI